MADSWSDGNAYEHFMGRWSRQVAPRFLRWLHAATGSALGRRRLRHRRADRDGPRASPPHRRAGARPERRVRRRGGRRVDDPRVEFAGRHGRSTCRPTSRRRRLRAGAQLRARPRGRPRRDDARQHRAARWRRTSGTTPAGCSSCARSGTSPARSTRPRSTSTRASASRSASPRALTDLWQQARTERRSRTSSIEVTTEFEDFDDFWAPFLGGPGAAPAYVATLEPPARERLREASRTDRARGPRRPHPDACPGVGGARAGRPDGASGALLGPVPLHGERRRRRRGRRRSPSR